jgi:hypothetical protein
MNELYPSDAQLNALSGLNDAEQEVLFIATGESPYYTSFYKMLYRLLDVSRRAGDLRVYKDGDLTFGVRAGRFCDGATTRDFAAASGQALTDNSTNSIYIATDGTLVVSTGGFPAAGATPHIPLAAIVTAGGVYSLADITDYRGRSMFQPLSAMTAAALNQVASATLAPTFTAATEAAGQRVISLQLKDLMGNNASQHVNVRVWLATSDYGAPDATGNTVAVSDGTVLQQVVANADYQLITDASGACAVGVTVAGAANRYVLAEIGGRVYSSGQITWSA